MLIIYELPDDFINPESAVNMVQKSMFWDLSDKWLLLSGTIADHLKVDEAPTPQTKRTRHKKNVNGEGGRDAGSNR